MPTFAAEVESAKYSSWRRKEIIVLASAARILTELAGCGCLGEGNLRLRGSMDITTIPEHHDRFSISSRAARQTGTRNTIRSGTVTPFFEIQKVVDFDLDP